MILSNYLSLLITIGAIMKQKDMLSGKELALLLHMTIPTLYRHLQYGPPSNSSIDVRQIEDKYVGGKRFWSRSSALALLEEG